MVVIPGRRGAASPESITTDGTDQSLENSFDVSDYGFRSASGRPRNDGGRLHRRLIQLFRSHAPFV